MVNKDHIAALEDQLDRLMPEVREAFVHVIAVLKSLDGQGSDVPVVQAAAAELPKEESDVV